MTKKELFGKIKEEQKKKAGWIRELKKSRKQDKRNGRELWSILGDIYRLKRDFRHTHIAYCELRGRSREQIECPREGNKASQYLIDKFKEEWLAKINENVCAGAQGSN